MKTDEDDEFDRIERENKMKGQPYHFALQRTWVGLTDEEIWQWFRDNTALTSESGKRIYDAIEAKLKEKNT